MALARVASRAADAHKSEHLEVRGREARPRARAADDDDARPLQRCTAMARDAPVPGDGPTPPMAPSPGTDNPAMNRDARRWS